MIGMRLALIAAVARNGVIGAGQGLPWRLSSDLQRFRRLTMGKPIIMGRKTFQSIGKALDRRTNIVITRDQDFSAEGVEIAASLEAALVLAREDAKRSGANELMIIGGADIFAAAMPLADRLEITHVHASPAGDVYFPAIDAKHWREDKRENREAGPDDSASYSVATYLRR